MHHECEKKKVLNVKLKRDEGLLHFVDEDGDISSKDRQGNVRKEVKTGIVREAGKYYFIDDAGDISVVEDVKEVIKGIQKDERELIEMFRLSGFEVGCNEKLKESHIDIQADMHLAKTLEDFRVIVECKFENSNRSLRNSIVDWKDKKDSFSASRVVLALFGVDPLGEDKLMAKQNDILIWESEQIAELRKRFKENLDVGRSLLFDELGIRGYLDPSIDHSHTIDY